jgi:hypothetical protein
MMFPLVAQIKNGIFSKPTSVSELQKNFKTLHPTMKAEY